MSFLYELSYRYTDVNNVVRVKFRLTVTRKRVADAVVRRWPGLTVTKRKSQEDTDVAWSSYSDIDLALALVARMMAL